MTNESNKSRKQAMLRKDWSVIPLKDEVSGNLSYEFTFPVGDDTMGCLELGNELSTREMSRSLARRTTLLPKRGAEAFIQKLIGAAPKKFVVKAGQPGWKRSPSSSDKGFVAFVTPGQITGPGAALFRSPASGNSRPQLGQHAGDIDVDGWSDSIGKLAELSNYIAFGIMAALAGPLLRFVELPEDPAFNFVGPSSGGKTCAAMAGASALGHPAAISNWDLTERAVEEAAAARNDCLLVLNAAEKASPKRRRGVLNRIVHMVAERQSTVRSESVQDRLPDLTWQTLLLTTSNKTGAKMANDLGLPWQEQEAVRFLDIPVPGPDDGGIVDRLRAAPDRASKSTRLIQAGTRSQETLRRPVGAMDRASSRDTASAARR